MYSIKLKLFIVCFVFSKLFSSSLHATEPDTLTNYNHLTWNSFSYTVGYWNDNFLFDKELNRLFNKNIFQTEDDFITSSFWLRVSKLQKYSSWFLDSYLNIATNRKLNIRTDFISFLLSYETQSEYGFFRIGGGFILTGNFGGRQIQSYYHRIFSIDELALPYLDESYFGLSINSSVKTVVVKTSSIQLNEITSVSLFTGGGPNSVESGLDGTYLIIEDQLLFNIHLGYKNYFSLNKSFESFLGKGIVWGIFSTVKIYKSIQASLWITGNQYGNQNQNHFGISFSLLSQKLLPISFSNVDFP